MTDDFRLEIKDFVTSHGISCEDVPMSGTCFLRAVSYNGGCRRELYILPAAIQAVTPEEAIREQHIRCSAREALGKSIMSAGQGIGDTEKCIPGIVTIAEDRWRSQERLYKARLLSHLGEFRSVFARKCKAVRIDKATASDFLAENHNYGPAACRYCYGLIDSNGEMAAAATFSNARKWVKGGKEIRSYEWVRYASAEGTRVPGGMGRLLSAFIKEVRPDDIMSYADLEWSDGGVYRRLGFMEDGFKEPVLFAVNPDRWNRTPYLSRRSSPTETQERTPACLWYMNDGSLKYRLRLTGYTV